jgi:hypothetical protein
MGCEVKLKQGSKILYINTVYPTDCAEQEEGTRTAGDQLLGQTRFLLGSDPFFIHRFTGSTPIQTGQTRFLFIVSGLGRAFKRV